MNTEELYMWIIYGVFAVGYVFFLWAKDTDLDKTVIGKLSAKITKKFETNKQKKIECANKKTSTLVRNFMRPYDVQHKKFVLANKNCLFEFCMKLNILICFDKKTKTVKYYDFKDEENLLRNYFKVLCVTFDFNTTYNNAYNLLKQNCVYLELYEDANMARREQYRLNRISINNLSAAEFLFIPGMNLGRANKVVKYIRKNDFLSIQDFIDFLELKEIYAKKILNMYKQKIISV